MKAFNHNTESLSKTKTLVLKGKNNLKREAQGVSNSSGFYAEWRAYRKYVVSRYS